MISQQESKQFQQSDYVLVEYWRVLKTKTSEIDSFACLSCDRT